ncbi:MAG: hypothetical protein DWQ34_18915 [Planctomycetota bacterium]|nr:MAG: hypothetical protein DWQ34_18915 [Planctomycetota bacterium]REJ95056.1 MAG: hypothetical protein DWQ29_02325 [Planctomycetota bacterium]REK21550.1 MAG: hypothetical protein DWQ41_21005 [Planctomycetota bacterium]REK39895.1 MAG: hypothetical protein DWQ45_01090 [Planctomycetota bacterium]
MLSERLEKLDTSKDGGTDWTSYQLADERLHKQLGRQRNQLARFPDATRRGAARETFDRYAYQWY